MSILGKPYPRASLLTVAVFAAHAFVVVQAWMTPNHPPPHLPHAHLPQYHLPHAHPSLSSLVWPASVPISVASRRWASYRPYDDDTDDNNNNDNDRSSALTTRVDGDGPLSSLTSLLDRLPQNLDVRSLQQSLNLERFKENVLGGGPLGERGEIYTLAQFIVLACVFGGGVPIFGDAILPLLGPVCLATGLGVLLAAVNDMGSTNTLSPWPKPVDDGILLTDGIFANLRHPLYSSGLLLSVGWSLITDSATRLLLTALLWYVLERKSDYEEDELLKKYPQQYADYQKQVTGKFIPNELIKNLLSSLSNKKD